MNLLLIALGCFLLSATLLYASGRPDNAEDCPLGSYALRDNHDHWHCIPYNERELPPAKIVAPSPSPSPEVRQ